MEISISLAIQHISTPWRRANLTSTIKQLNLRNSALIREFWIEEDKIHKSCTKTCLFALKRASLLETSHFVLIEDDIELCSNFLEIISTLIRIKPNDVIAPYICTLSDKKHKTLEQLYKPTKATWILIIPTNLCLSMHNWISKYVDMTFDLKDVAIGLFCAYHNINSWRILPLICRHLGRESIRRGKTRPIEEMDNIWFIEDNQVDWRCDKIQIFKTTEIYKPIINKLLKHNKDIIDRCCINDLINFME